MSQLDTLETFCEESCRHDVVSIASNFPDFEGACDHAHDESCPQCSKLETFEYVREWVFRCTVFRRM